MAGMTMPKAEPPDAAEANGRGGGGAAPGPGGDILGGGVHGLPDVVFDGGYRIPGDIYARLFDYQKTGAAGRAPCLPRDLLLCTSLSHIKHSDDLSYGTVDTGVKWMWELHTQRAGGIVGDEMGLGKTVQARSLSRLSQGAGPRLQTCIVLEGHFQGKPGLAWLCFRQ